MTEQEQKAFEQMRQALKDIAEESFDKGAVECANHAIAAANAVSEQQGEAERFNCPECKHSFNVADELERPRLECPVCGHEPINENLNHPGPAHPQATEPAGCGGRSYCSRMPFCGCGGPEGLPERDTSKPAEAQGLFRKFDVTRTDGSSAPGGKHHGCEYFVLDVDHDPHAKSALQAYALACASTHPQLSADLMDRYGVHPQVTEPQPPLECDSPELCKLNRACAGQFGTKKQCAANPQATEPAGFTENKDLPVGKFGLLSKSMQPQAHPSSFEVEQALVAQSKSFMGSR